MRPLGWWTITVYAIAMAFVEAACVVSLKRPYFPDGWQPPFHDIPAEGLRLEQAREIATLVMIAAVAWMGRRSWRDTLARALWIFGVWDLGYYVALAIVTGFPKSLADLDVVFLVPHAWVAPAWVPVAASIACLAIALRLRPRGAL